MPGPSVLYQGPSCPHCWEPLDLTEVRSGRQHCPRCAREFEAVRFTPPARTAAVAAAAGDEAACPLHRGNAAVDSCGRCGVFLCGLCRIEVDAQVLCPACFSRLGREGELLVGQRTFRDYDGVALLFVVVGLLTGVGGVVTGPVAVYFALRARRQRLAWGDAAHGGRVAAAAVLAVVNVALSVGLMALVIE